MALAPTVAAQVLQARLRVVGRLRQEPANVDAVGRTEVVLRLRSGRIRESLLGEALAVVELATHRERNDVLPQQVNWCCCRGETRPAGNSTTTGTRAPVEGGGDRAAGDHPRSQRGSSRAGGHSGRHGMMRDHCRGEETGADVLEGSRRPVKHLEHRHTAFESLQRAQGNREVERLRTDGAQVLRQARVGKEWRQQRPAIPRNSSTPGERSRLETRAV